MGTKQDSQEDENTDSISNSIELSENESQTKRIISYYIIEEGLVKRYEDAKKWEKKIGVKPTAALVGWYIGIIVVGAFFDADLTTGWSIPNILTAIVTIVPMILSITLWVSKKIFQNRANKLSVSPEEAVYHRLSRAVQEFQNNNIGPSMSELERANELMKDDDIHPFSPDFTEQLTLYADQVAERDSEEFFKKTFPKAANKIVKTLSPLTETNMEHIYSEHSELEQAEGYTPTEMFKSYIGDWGESRVVRIAAPYVLISPIIYLVYTQNQALAQILALIVVAIVQTYNRPGNES